MSVVAITSALNAAYVPVIAMLDRASNHNVAALGNRSAMATVIRSCVREVMVHPSASRTGCLETRLERSRCAPGSRFSEVDGWCRPETQERIFSISLYGHECAGVWPL